VIRVAPAERYVHFGENFPNVPADTTSSFTTDGAGVTTSAPGEERNDIVELGSAGCVALLYGTLSTTLNTQGATRKLVPGLQEARGTSFSTALVTGVGSGMHCLQSYTLCTRGAGNGTYQTESGELVSNDACRKLIWILAKMRPCHWHKATGANFQG
jgi:hypothetical protein